MVIVTIADNQTLTREGIIAVLSAADDISIIGIAKNQAELRQLIVQKQPDVVIIDHLEVFDIKALQIDLAKILVASSAQKREDVNNVLSLGINNYISKSCSSQELIDAVHATAQGDHYYCNKTNKLLSEDKNTVAGLADIPNLSAREMEIVKLIAEGLTNNEISEKLFISIHTTKTHRKNILKKLGFTFKNAAELITQLNSLQ